MPNSPESTIEELLAEYEKEWRLFRRLPDGVFPEQFTEKDRDDFPVYLFDLPADSIKEIIFGCRLSLENRKAIRQLASKKLLGTVIKRVELCRKEYKIMISEDV